MDPSRSIAQHCSDRYHNPRWYACSWGMGYKPTNTVWRFSRYAEVYFGKWPTQGRYFYIVLIGCCTYRALISVKSTPDIRKRVASIKEQQTSGWKHSASSLKTCTSSLPICIQGTLPEECWTISIAHFREYECHSVETKGFRSLASFTNGTALNPCEEILYLSRAYAEWKCLNRLRHFQRHRGTARALHVLLHKWGCLKDNQDANCEFGSELHTLLHFKCPLLEQVCTTEDLAAETVMRAKYFATELSSFYLSPRSLTHWSFYLFHTRLVYMFILTSSLFNVVCP